MCNILSREYTHIHAYYYTHPGGRDSTAVCTAVVVMDNCGGFNTTSFQQYGSTTRTPAGSTSRHFCTGLLVVPSEGCSSPECAVGGTMPNSEGDH